MSANGNGRGEAFAPHTPAGTSHPCRGASHKKESAFPLPRGATPREDVRTVLVSCPACSQLLAATRDDGEWDIPRRCDGCNALFSEETECALRDEANALLTEGDESAPSTVLPDTASLSAVASSDARSAKARPAQHPARPANRFLRLVEDPEAFDPESLDGIALMTIACIVRDLHQRVIRLEQQVKDINYREAV